MMKTYNRKATFTLLKPYCYFAQPEDFIEVTEWHNGEGIDVTINTKSGEKHISLTHGEFEALVAVAHYKAAPWEGKQDA